MTLPSIFGPINEHVQPLSTPLLQCLFDCCLQRMRSWLLIRQPISWIRLHLLCEQIVSKGIPLTLAHTWFLGRSLHDQVLRTGSFERKQLGRTCCVEGKLNTATNVNLVLVHVGFNTNESHVVSLRQCLGILAKLDSGTADPRLKSQDILQTFGHDVCSEILISQCHIARRLHPSLNLQETTDSFLVLAPRGMSAIMSFTGGCPAESHGLASRSASVLLSGPAPGTVR